MAVDSELVASLILSTSTAYEDLQTAASTSATVLSLQCQIRYLDPGEAAERLLNPALQGLAWSLQRQHPQLLQTL
ncbi:hypothetical protein PILCRDRAFT_16184 [Piloderma croceum F 1598]|uniref:Uncharacterized protein n=1 Tax=Piloderma croceum (strain F 1598) TaxID=765440 RepID=A0A0C3EX93_PILCF|nr:hypothetical protein PILCRDRAFT_16184 [Piloderma croceum F 1598]